MAAASGFTIARGSAAGNDWVSNSVPHAAATKTLRFTHKPILSGLCNCGKYLPCQFLGAGGLVLEFELGGAADWVSTAASTSQNWHISDVRVQASVININSQLMEAYSAHVL